MSKFRHRRISRLHALCVPVLTVAVIGASAGLAAPPHPHLVAAAADIELTSTIDTSNTTVGIADSSLYFMDQGDLDTAMGELQSMGVTQIRVFLPWRAMEPSDGSYDWTQADQLLDTAASYGIAVDAAITSTPTWASQYGGVVANGAPTAATDYADFVKAVASRYGAVANDGTAKISSYEIWNEPNGFTGWFPTPDAAAYTELLKDAYTAIKSVDPTATVVGGVLGAGISIGSLTINPVTFLQEMYADGAAGYFDALAFHPYNYTSLFSAGNTFVNSALEQLGDLRQLMDANGDAAKLIWATEYGEPSTQAGEANQAAYIQDFLTTWASLSGVGPEFLYSLIDTATGSSTAEDNLGIFTDDWTPKEAVAVIEAWIAAHPVTTTTPSGPAGVVAAIVAAVSHAIHQVITGISNIVTGVATVVRQFATGVVNAVTNLLKSLSPAAKATSTAALSVKTALVKTTAAAVTTTAATDTTSDAKSAVDGTAAIAAQSGDTKSTEKKDKASAKAKHDPTATAPVSTPTAPKDADSQDPSASTPAGTSAQGSGTSAQGSGTSAQGSGTSAQGAGNPDSRPARKPRHSHEPGTTNASAGTKTSGDTKAPTGTASSGGTKAAGKHHHDGAGHPTPPAS